VTCGLGADASWHATRPPLPERMRPRSLDEVVGQEHLIGPGKPLTLACAERRLFSLLFWGPPGVGKTTLAQLLAAALNAHFFALSAVHAGVKELRTVVEEAEVARAKGRATLLFLDEIHRFHKGQQDALLPHVESGLVTLIGATTENPSFEVNAALLSRLTLFRLEPLSAAALSQLIDRAAHRFPDEAVPLDQAVIEQLIDWADGDARRLLNDLEWLWTAARSGGLARIDLPFAGAVLGERRRRFDKGGDTFYDQISALHKAVRGSDPDAALYWLCRMLDGGADPRYLARRLVRIASEEIGLADPRALTLAVDAAAAYERLGSPEGELALAQALVYLACAPKSNALYRAFQAAQGFVARTGSLPVPWHLRNAPTRLLKTLGAGRGYRYPHDEPGGYAPGVAYFPDGVEAQRWYQPTGRGLEQQIAEKLRHLRKRDAAWRAEQGGAPLPTESSSCRPKGNDHA